MIKIIVNEGQEIDKGDTSPSEGGCWFCHEDEGGMKFSQEFDAFYHRECATSLGVQQYDRPILAYEQEK